MPDTVVGSTGFEALEMNGPQTSQHHAFNVRSEFVEVLGAHFLSNTIQSVGGAQGHALLPR